MNLKWPKNQILLLIALLQFTLPTISLCSNSDEYLIKTAFLVKFLDFIQWQDKPDASSKATMVIIGKDPFGAYLDDYLSDTLEKRNKLLKVLRTDWEEEIPDCEIIFLKETKAEKISKVLEQVNSKGVLTIGENKSFTKLGGIISFIIHKNRVRFIINLKAAKKAGIKISSKLLKLAHSIEK